MGRFIFDFDDDLSRWLRAESRKRGMSVNHVVRGILDRARGRGAAASVPGGAAEGVAGTSLEDEWRGMVPSVSAHGPGAPSYLRQSRFPEEPVHREETEHVRPRISAEDIENVEPRVPVEALLRRRRAAKAEGRKEGGAGNAGETPAAAAGKSLAEQWKSLQSSKPEAMDATSGRDGNPISTDD